MEHLSDEWITAFDDVVRDHDGLRAATAASHLVIQYTVTELPDARNGTSAETRESARAAEYAVVLDHGDNRVLAGRRDDAEITLRTDRRTAAAIASHTESAQSAFMAGRLRLGGDVRVLIANQLLLAQVDDCAGVLRAATDFGAAPERTAAGA